MNTGDLPSTMGASVTENLEMIPLINNSVLVRCFQKADPWDLV